MQDSTWKLQDQHAEDSTASIYDYLYNRTHFAKGMYSNFAKIVGRYRGKTLELGCGTGTITSLLGAGDYYCIDFSFKMLQVAKTKCSNVLQADMEHLPYPDGAFDVALVSSALHHFPSLDGVISEIKRVLKPNGYLLIQEPNQHKIAFTWMLRQIHWRLHTKLRVRMYPNVSHIEEKPSEHHAPLTIDKVIEPLKRQEFNILSAKYHYYVSYLFSDLDSKFVYILSRMLDSHYVAKKNDGYMFVVIGQRS
jgi:ubiquinone/menaquinone biosynthesis C-methylase UbiE